MRAELARRRKLNDVVEWGEKHFYIPETGRPIILAPHQRAVLRYCLRRDSSGRFPFSTIVWSSIKKSGKTAISGLVGRWAAETWGRYGEIYCLGNDAKQAQTRAFAAICHSIELSPGYDHKHERLPEQWELLTKSAKCLTTGSGISALAVDSTGEAGANPTLTLWTELWGVTHKAGLDFWAEMTPSPTRLNSMRWVETYAGFEGESELLWGLYDATVNRGRQLTMKDLLEYDPQAGQAFKESPHPDDPVPCYVNDAGRMFCYWDRGEHAKRMPWQQGEHGDAYYASEAATLTPPQYTRLHEDDWVSAESAFIQIAWWDACLDPLPLKPGEKTPLIIGLDAAVSGDCFGLTVVSRDPKAPRSGLALRMAQKWTPPPGGKIDFAGPREALRWLCKNYNVVEVAYDNYQLYDFCHQLEQEGLAWFSEFSQAGARLVADKMLYDIIVERRIRHDGNADVREHLTNCNARIPKDESNKLRLVKKSESRKIDLAVCLSMSSFECLRLNL